MAEGSEGVRVRGLLADGAVRLLLVEAHAIAEHTRQAHGLGPDAARLAGDGIVAASLLAAHIKGDEQITLQLQGSDPRCSLYVDATTEGALRARVTPSDLVLGEGGTLSGVMVAVKHVGREERYRGITAVESTSMEGALSEHLGTSNQVDAILRIAVSHGDDGAVHQAGGVLIERLPAERDQPSLTPEAFASRFGWVRSADATRLLTQLAFGALGDDELHVLESAALRWECRCSEERIEATLVALGPEALLEMIEEDHGAQVTCNFCNTTYVLDETRLRELVDRGAG